MDFNTTQGRKKLFRYVKNPLEEVRTLNPSERGNISITSVS